MPVEENRKYASQLRAMKKAGIDETGRKVDGPSPDQIESGLRATSDLSKATGHPGQDIRHRQEELFLLIRSGVSLFHIEFKHT